MNPSPEISPPAEVAAEAQSAPKESLTLRQSVNKAAGLLASEALSNGDRAALRRISPDKPFTPALWKVLYRLKRAGAPVGIGSETREHRWATLLMGMAFCISPHSNLHDYHVPLGRALAEAGWSELRFVQLLRAEGKALDVHVRRVAQYLASKSQKANWAHVADLLFNQSNEWAEKTRLSISRSYYGALYAKEQS